MSTSACRHLVVMAARVSTTTGSTVADVRERSPAVTANEVCIHCVQFPSLLLEFIIYRTNHVTGYREQTNSASRTAIQRFCVSVQILDEGVHGWRMLNGIRLAKSSNKPHNNNEPQHAGLIMCLIMSNPCNHACIWCWCIEQPVAFRIRFTRVTSLRTDIIFFSCNTTRFVAANGNIMALYKFL